MSEIIQRDNPLTRHLNAIAALNEQHGTRAEGGTGVPVVKETSGGVSLPPAERISAEEEAQLQADWAAEQAGRNFPPEILSRPERGPVHHPQPSIAPLTDFTTFDLAGGRLYGNNGDSFPLTSEMVKSLKMFGFQVAREGIAQQLVALAATLGVDLTQQPGGQNATNNEAVPPVQGDETNK